MRRRGLGVLAGCVAALLAAGGWLWARGRGPAGVPAAKIETLVADAPPARVSSSSAPGPWLLADGTFASSASAFAVGDAGIGPDPAHVPCPVTVGLGCAGGGFVLVSADGGSTWRRAYQGRAQLEGISAWPGGGAIAWGPDALVRGVPSGGWLPVAMPGPGEVAWGSFPSPADWWVSLDDGCASSHGLLLACRDAVFATTDAGRTWRIIARTASYPRAAPGAKLLARQSVEGQDFGGGHGWLRDAVAQYATSDGGETWAEAGPGLNDAVMTDAQRGFRLSDLPPSGQDSTTTGVLATTDGERTWLPVGRIGQVVGGLRAARDGSLWAIATQYRTVGTHGWACAATTPQCGPAVWVSADGGRTWSQHPTPDARLAWVAPLDASRALAGAAAADGRDELVLTTDGGRTWTAVAAGGPQPGPSLDVGFWSQARGWGYGLPGDRFATLFTGDGGRTWRRAGDLPAGSYDATFTDPRHGLVEMPDQGWRVTSNGGASWQVPPQPPPGNLAGFNVATFGRSGFSALLSSDSPPRTLAAISTDGGRHWSTVPVPKATAALRFASATEAWAAQQTLASSSQPPRDVLMHTVDGGRTWHPTAELPNDGVPLLAAPAPGQLWVVTAIRDDRWVLLRTVDAGAHWLGYRLPTPLADTYFAGDRLSAVSADDGWLLTHSGLWRTADGGSTWTRVAEP